MPVKCDGLVMYSLGRDTNEERLEDDEELEQLRGLTAQPGEVGPVVNFRDPL